jgi:hypothetical protein
MLNLVGDDERYLGFGVSRRTVITTHGDEAIFGLGHEGEPVHIVDTGEVLYLLGRQFGMK